MTCGRSVVFRYSVLNTTLCDKVCKWLVAGLWFSGTLFLHQYNWPPWYNMKQQSLNHFKELMFVVLIIRLFKLSQAKLSSLILRMDQMSTASYSRKWFIRGQGSTVVEKIHTWCKEQSLTLLYISLTHPVKLSWLPSMNGPNVNI